MITVTSLHEVKLGRMISMHSWNIYLTVLVLLKYLLFQKKIQN